MTLFGWDSSDFDHGRGPMDLSAAAQAGISFFTHKATEGTSVRHHPGPALVAARAAQIPFLGVYIVPRSTPPVAAQVDYLLTWMDDQAPWWKTFAGWFWQIDTEHWPYDAVSAQQGYAVARELSNRTGKACLHYAPEWAYGGSVPLGQPLWASSYVAGSGNFLSLYPGDGSSHWHAYSGREPSILQYTSSATIGRQPLCDANAFRGDAAQFASMIGGTMVNPKAPAMDSDYVTRAKLSAIYNLDDPVWLDPAAAGPAFHSTLVAAIRDIQAQARANGAGISALSAKLDGVGQLTDAQVAAGAKLIADALVASGANSLTQADHAAIQQDLVASLPAALSKLRLTDTG